MLRRFFIPLLVGATGCMSASPTSSTGPGKKDGEVDLGVSPGWVDTAADYARDAGDPPTTPEARKAALVNPDAPVLVIENVTILTGTGARIDNGSIVLEDGAIKHVGEATAAPTGARVIDGKGRYVTPGIIDTHSHIGVYSTPHVEAHADGNEATAPVTAQARAAYGYFAQDPAITRARAGGVTTALILPGSANLIGGRGATVIMRPGRAWDAVEFPGAPRTLKMACGENPKRVYGEKGGPSTRMGEYAAFRAAFQQALEYDAKRAAYRRARAVWEKKKAKAEELTAAAKKAEKDPPKIPGEPAPEPPPRDLSLETLAAVLRGEVLVQIHCYRAGEIREMVRIADEFGFRIRSFHHALEAYKVRDILVDHDIAINTWADWWGFKMEAFDGIRENAALFAEAGGRPVIHSDDSIGIQRLNQETAKAMYAGRAAGIDISDEEAIKWITANAAWVMGIEDVTGTLEPGKRADVVLWSASPFSVYARPDLVIQGGEPVYDRADGIAPTDFELGNSAISPLEPAPDRAPARHVGGDEGFQGGTR